MVSRLSGQKGLDLLLAALESLLALDVQLVLLGTGEPDLEQAFRRASERHAGQVAVHIGYDEPLAHRIIAGADVILVPSRFEPCGLTQLYGLRYGTLPLVRRVGGLANTVIDADTAAMTSGEANGFTFDAASPAALLAAARRAVDAWQHPARWAVLCAHAMGSRFSWDMAARQYHDLYLELRHREAGLEL